MNVYILLDRSGSMETQWNEALGSINGYVEELPTKAKIMLAVFDSNGYDVIRATTAKEWKKVTREDASPRGGTPLFDSAMRMMQRIEEDRPDRAVFVVMTDGEENQSQKYRQHEVKAMADRLRSKDYQVVFLGANFDKVGDVAASFGTQRNQWMNISTNNLGDTMRGFAATSTAYMTGAAASVSFSDADKEKATKLTK
jgi:Mg-chelatase subunit ChlD